MSTKHKLFSTYPLNGKVELSTGLAQTPYHIYDGYGLFIAGTANLEAIKTQLQGEALHPITTTDGYALVGMWLLDFPQASLAPHSELQCSILAHEKQIPPLENHPFAPLEYLVKTEQASILCANIWNSTEECVAYNSEHLGLGANLCQSTFEKDGKTLSFNFSANDVPLIAGSVEVPSSQPLPDVWTMLRRFGFRTLSKLITPDFTQVDVINRRSDVIPINARARPFTKEKTAIATTINSETDHLSFGDIPFAHIDFQPQIFQYFDGFKFVYLDPKR